MKSVVFLLLFFILCLVYLILLCSKFDGKFFSHYDESMANWSLKKEFSHTVESVNSNQFPHKTSTIMKTNRTLTELQSYVSLLETTPFNQKKIDALVNKTRKETSFPAIHNQSEFSQMHNLEDLNKELDKHLQKAENVQAHILLWEPKFNVRKHYSLDTAKCGWCDITYDKSMIKKPETKAVVFHFLELLTKLKSKLPLKKRRPDQYFVFWVLEPSAVVHDNMKYDLDMYDDMFNLTMSYRQDSDVYDPYDSLVRVVESIRGKRLREIDVLMKRKTKLALWVVSNCGSTRGARKRMALAKKLIAHGLEVQLGGGCFYNGVWKWRYEKYKFYLAFENSYHCKDYITEKFYRKALENGIVPVVFGAIKVDYLVAAPPNSFIYAEDYTVSELVDYLSYLDKNDTAYRKYLEWREMNMERLTYTRRAKGFCHLCRIIHGINYDNIYNPNYEIKYSSFPIFGGVQRRVVHSLSDWFYKSEHADCFDHSLATNATTATSL